MFKLIKALFNFSLPSYEYFDDKGKKWRATMITPFDTFHERVLGKTKKP